MKKKVSIIVPVYNVKEYLPKCLDSLVNQSLDSYEIILINDGSPFGEDEIIEQYYKKYPEKIIPINKENGGYGSGLEVGISKAECEYILVCDSDDYLDPNCIETLYARAISNELDIVIGAKNLVYSDNSETIYDKSFNSNFVDIKEHHTYINNTEEYNNLYFIDPSPHAKLYRYELVKELRFPHKVSYTDNILYFCSLSKANKVEYIHNALSYYLINRVGNTMTDIKPKTIDDLILVFKEVLKEAKGRPILYYRLFDSFYEIFWQIDRIKGDKSTKEEKYEKLYSFLELLIEYKNEITNMMGIYSKDSKSIREQKAKLLDEDKSKAMYDALVQYRLSPNVINRIKMKFLSKF